MKFDEDTKVTIGIEEALEYSMFRGLRGASYHDPMSTTKELCSSLAYNVQ
jgi:hypothetical protein